MNERGYHHIAIGGLILVAIGLFLFSPYLMNKVNDVYRDRAATAVSQGGPYYLDHGHAENVSLDMGSILDSLSDAEIKLIRLKTDALLLTWDSLDASQQNEALKAFSKDLKVQEGKILSFWVMVNSQKWELLTQEEKNKKIDDILLGLLEDQRKLIHYVEIMNY
jgi:hypothetical protein